ncbi:MAG: hypothetical protein IIA82_08285 [Thaumarchaeota archaeon]|nr:hypothetical protein [Nitrososphaerota archaeon]
MEFTFTEQISIILGIIGLIFGAIGMIYGIKKKRELTRSQLKTEQTKRSAYRSKKKAADAQTAESHVKIWKNIFGFFK